MLPPRVFSYKKQPDFSRPDWIQFSLAHSNVSSFKVLPLENILSYILQTEIIPSANAKLSKTLPNLANVTLTRPHITIVQAFIHLPECQKFPVFELLKQ
ncbi:BPI fold-containing family C protein [Sylvia borin]